MSENPSSPIAAQFKNDLFSFTILPAGQTEWRGFHSQSELGFNFSDVFANWSIDGSPETRKRAPINSFVHYPLGIEHYVRAINLQSRLKFNWSDGYLDLLLGESAQPEILGRFQDYQEDAVMMALARNVMGTMNEKSPFLDLQIDGYAQAILGRFFHLHNELPNFQNNHKEHRMIALAVDYAMDNLNSRLTVSLLAEKAGLSIWHFSRLFKTTIGEPPHRWVMKQRVSRAMHLLRFSKLSLGEIAFECGFSHPAHLGSTLKKWTHKTPIQIRGE